jgi:cyclic pyranopterin phosphate synthase
MEQTQLVDRFGRRHTYLRVSVTDRCNLQCRYCMPRTDVSWTSCEALLSDEEIVRLARLFAKCGVDKIRLTGGEPTLRPHLDRLVLQLAVVPGISTVAMTTNGVTLARLAHRLKAAGLTAINVSLDTLQPERFKTLTGTNRLADVMAGIDAALDAGFVPLRINTVVMRHVNDDELSELVSLARTRPVCVRFIEYMPSHTLFGGPDTLVPFDEMKRTIQRHVSLEPLWAVSADAFKSRHGVAREFAAAGFVGTIGFITPRTDQFCERCNRLRLTADGRLKSCLFYPAEVSLKQALRRGDGDEQVISLITEALSRKKLSPPLPDRTISAEAPGMYAVGG